MKATGERFIPDAGMGEELELEHMHRYRAVAPLLEGLAVLDAACGAGYGSALLAEHATSVTGIDIDAETVEYARGHYSRDNLSFLQMSIAELSFPDASFDAVISFETIEHVPEELQMAFLAQVRRILKPDGFFVVSTPDLDVFMRRSHGTYCNPFHIKEYNASDFRALLSQYFPCVTLHRQGKVRCSVIDGEGTALLNGAPDSMDGEYIIAVCAMQEKRLALGSVYQPTESAACVSAGVYFDYGDGYSEAHKLALQLYPTGDGQFKISFDVPGDGQLCSVRVDPCYFPVKIFDIRGTDNSGRLLDLRPLNRNVANERFDGFMHQNPSYELVVSPKQTHITVSGFYEPYQPAEVFRFWSEKLREQEALTHGWETKLREASERIGQISAESAAFAEQMRAQLAERNTVIAQQQSQLAERDDLLAQQQSQMTQQSNVIAQQSGVIAQQQSQLAERDDLLAQQQSQMTQQSNVIAQQSGVIAQQQSQLAERDNLLAEQQNQIAVLQLQYDEVTNAFFWKVTKPLRRALDTLKKNRLVFLFDKGLHSLKAFGVKTTWARVKTYRQQESAIAYAVAAEEQPEVTLRTFIERCKASGGEVFGEELLLGHSAAEMVLLVSHELNLTGAPIALQYFAESLQRQGILPVLIAPRDDALRPLLTEEGIPVLTHPALYQSSLVADFALLFSMIIINTNVGAPIAAQLSGSDVPVLWWIHEAHVSYHPGALAEMPETLGENIHVYCGGAWAQNVLRQYRPGYEADVLLYCVPDLACAQYESDFVLENTEGKTVFASVGTQEERKGQDVLAEAIHRLSAKERDKSLFVFVGREHYPPIRSAIRALCEQYPECVCYIPELSKSNLRALYEQMDCLICTSKDDPMPIVVTDALALSKTVICSENTGSAALLQEMGSGYVYHNNDPAELSAMISRVLSKPDDLAAICQRARQTYEKHFMQEAFDRNVARIIAEMTARERGLLDFSGRFSAVSYGGLQEIHGESILRQYAENGKRNILLFSHELSLTGAPVVLHQLGQTLRAQGNNVVFLSPFDGPLGREIEADEFPLVLFERVYDCGFLRKTAACFDLIFLNTVVPYRAVTLLADTGVPVLWWIHDSKLSYKYLGDCMPKELPANVKVFCGGAYAKKQLMLHYPKYQAQELLYAVNDCSNERTKNVIPSIFNEGKFVFLIIGTIEYRKGQDIMAEAIRLLHSEERSKCLFLFMGKEQDGPIVEAEQKIRSEYPENVRYIERIAHNELVDYYRNATCLICCSRDDPMPVVVTEMQALSKPVICSENTGSAALIRETGGGILYENDDPAALAEKIRFVINASDDELADIGAKGRLTYERYFTREVFDETIRKLVEHECSLERRSELASVSVVIPTYNAGAGCRTLMEALRGQKGIGPLEIVVVDSGSTDGTQDICRAYGAKVIQITQAEFSHSYARNLGAKNASGRILLFMTQDALPSGDQWIEGMIAPILEKQAVAVSCREECPPETDLYYRVASWLHSLYLGTVAENRIGTLRAGMTSEELRKAASLNDVACAVKRDVFLRFGYRHSYAEDLDLGMRLLKSGYGIALLHEPAVIHGHTRPASYYLRRSMVNFVSLKKILEQQTDFLSAEETASFILPAYIVTENVLSLLETGDCIHDLKDFPSEWEKVLQKYMLDWNVLPFPDGSDALIADCVSMLRPYWNGNVRWELVHAISAYCTDPQRLMFCLQETGWITRLSVKDLCDCLRKQAADQIGAQLSNLSPDAEVYPQIAELGKGV